VKISIVVPIYNEKHNVRELHSRIVKTMEENSYDFEIIFINDGSNDGGFEIMQNLRPLKIINFRKNFGQTAAMDAGIKHASGEYIVTLDGDGQNDPADIPLLIEKLMKDKLDVVSGWRKNRKDTFMKKTASRMAAMLRKALIDDGIHDSGCSLKIYKKECFEHVDLYGEIHRFIPAILKIKGFKIGEIPVNHFPRINGKTKYNWTRGIKGITDMMTIWFWKKYSDRPLHLFGGVGLILTFLSILLGIFVGYQKIFNGLDLSSTALTTVSISGFLIGVQFFAFGLIADWMAKSYFSVTKDTPYVVKDIIENK